MWQVDVYKRQPINIILGTMQVVNKKIEKNNLEMDSLKKYGKYIKQNSYRLLRLANNLIDISKMDIGAYELRCSNPVSYTHLARSYKLRFC